MPVNEQGLTITITAKCGTAEYTEVIGVGHDGSSGLSLTTKQAEWIGRVICYLAGRADKQRVGKISTQAKDHHTQARLSLYGKVRGVHPSGLGNPPEDPYKAKDLGTYSWWPAGRPGSIEES